MINRQKLIDPFGREIKYLRISVTDRCNLKCSYCSPKQGFHPEGKYTEYLSFEEITRIAKSFINLGVKHIRLTGGEPLVRKNLPLLVGQINNLSPDLDLSISTNATHLKRTAKSLYDNGVKRLNVSLDSLNAEKFHRITRGGDLKTVLDNIYLAKEIGFNLIKINCVIMKGVNNDEIGDLVDWAKKYQLELRFIEIMPIGNSGIEQMNDLITAQEIMQRVEEHLGSSMVPAISKQGAGPAKYYRIEGSDTGIGIISAISNHFCASCNRVRLTSRGILALCLGQEDSVNLRDALRDNISDLELQNLIIDAIKLKPERHFFKENRHHIKFRQMVSLGG